MRQVQLRAAKARLSALVRGRRPRTLGRHHPPRQALGRDPRDRRIEPYPSRPVFRQVARLRTPG